MTLAVAPVTGSILVTCEYNPDPVDGIGPGLAWVILHDNPVLAWLVDETGAVPVVPVILGSMGGPPPDTSPVKSPAWIVREGTTLFAPDIARGTPTEMFYALATNNGANRPIYAKFADYDLAVAWNQWARDNPLALKDPPNV
jgi:hypothetical protein